MSEAAMNPTLLAVERALNDDPDFGVKELFRNRRELLRLARIGAAVVEADDATVERVARAVMEAIKADCTRTDGTCYAYGDMGCSYDSAGMEVDGEFSLEPIARAALAAAATTEEGSRT